MSVEDTPTIEDPKAVLAALDKAKKEAKQFREERDALQVKVAELESDDTLTKMQQRIVKTEAKSRLIADGVKDPDRILKYLNAEGVKVTDEGIEGLDDVLTTVRKDFPELFDKKRQVGGGADSADRSSSPVSKSVTELQAEALLSG